MESGYRRNAMGDNTLSNYEKYFGSPERVALTIEMIDSFHHDSMNKKNRLYEASIVDCACETMGFPEDVPMSGHRILEWLYDVPALYIDEKWVRDCEKECESCPRGIAFEELDRKLEETDD